MSAIITVSGRTNRTQFQQAINQVVAQLRQNINEVSAGYYPNRGFTCTPNGATVSLTAGSTDQGTNSGCILLGRALQFGITGTDPQQFIVYPLAARQLNTTGDQVQSLSEAGPKVVSPSSSLPNTPDSTDAQKLQYGLTVSKMYYNGDENNKIGALAFVSTLAQYEGTEVLSGSQRLTMLAIGGTALDKNQTQGAEAINANLVSNSTSPSGGVSICFDSGTTNQSGLVKIGGNNNQLSVTLTVIGKKGC
jgi:hypothetical protein